MQHSGSRMQCCFANLFTHWLITIDFLINLSDRLKKNHGPPFFPGGLAFPSDPLAPMPQAQLWLSSMLARGWPPCLSLSLRAFPPPAPQLLIHPLPWLLFCTLSLCDLTDFHNFSYHLCYFPRAATTKYHSQSGLKQQRFIVSPFWRLEVWNQGVKGATLPLKALGKDTSCLFQLPVLLASLGISCIAPLSPLVITWLSACVSHFTWLSSYKGTHH